MKKNDWTTLKVHELDADRAGELFVIATKAFGYYTRRYKSGKNTLEEYAQICHEIGAITERLSSTTIIRDGQLKLLEVWEQLIEADEELISTQE